MTESVQGQRGEFLNEVSTIPWEKLVFVDESGSNIAMTRAYGRATRGERLHDAVPRNRGTVTTMIGAHGWNKFRGMLTVEGATDANVFEVFCEKILAPTLAIGDVVIWDNVGAHRPERIRAIIEGAGATVKFLPPYSPDLNPIEECWSKFKSVLKKMEARTRKQLDKAIAIAMDQITVNDIAGWFSHSGYVAQLK